MDQTYPLPIPPTWSAATRHVFVDFARRLMEAPPDQQVEIAALAKLQLATHDSPSLLAAVSVLGDLAVQGWKVEVEDDTVAATPPISEVDAIAEKDRVRRQELIKRNEQLALPSVRRFIAEMERPREFRGEFVSIFSLMRDGQELEEAVRCASDDGSDVAWRSAIDPYVQVIEPGQRCEHTGLRLVDIWRYFRHTWINQYTSTPGRTLLILVRDRAERFHPVVGIAALGSAIVQLRERDEWIGWQPQEFLARLAERPSARTARWVMRRLDQGLSEVYVEDLIEDGLYWPSLWDRPKEEVIEQLLKEAEVRRRDHHRYARRSDFKWRGTEASEDGWETRARSDLFRSKRCLALADLLRTRAALIPFLSPPTQTGLQKALDNAVARRAILSVVRRAKSEAVGTEIADLTVCGAVAPYNHLLGGKLVSMLAVSPTVAHAYHDRYANYSSEIASSVAGRAIHRRSNLVFVGTTSLYASGSSQYNRIRIPSEVLAGKADIVFRRLGKSRSFGTSHLSSESVSALVRLAEHSHTGVRINSIFGEGVNPKFRKVRAGLDLLGWPSEQLLQHRRSRIVYGVSLVTNLLPYLLGLDKNLRYAYRRTLRDDVERISRWWTKRWLKERAKSSEVLSKVREHRSVRPVRHGARVTLPPVRDREQRLWDVEAEDFG